MRRPLRAGAGCWLRRVLVVAAALAAAGSMIPTPLTPVCIAAMNWGGAVVPLLLGGAGLWLHWRRPRPGARGAASAPWRAGWGLLCAGLLLWSAAQWIWLYQEQFRDEKAPFPGIPDIAYFAVYPMFISGLLLLFAPAGSGCGQRVRVLLDSLLTAMVAGLAGWYFFCLDAGRLTVANGEAALTFVYVAGDVALVFLAVKLWLRGGPSARRAAFLLLPGILLFSAGDALFFRHTACGFPQNNLWFEWMWTCGLMVIGLAAVAPTFRTDSNDGRQEGAERSLARGAFLWRSVFPYVVGMAGFGLVWSWDIAVGHRRHHWEIGLVGIVSVMMIMARQVVLLLENWQLHRRVEERLDARTLQVSEMGEEIGRHVRQEEELERRVRERTAELEAANVRLRLGLEGSKVGIWELDARTGLMKGRLWSEIVGFGPGEVPGTVAAWLAAIHPSESEKARQGMEEHLAGRLPLFEAEYRVADKGGAWRWILTRGRVVSRNASGRAERAVGMSMDVTEQRTAEENLREAQKMESLGLLAGGVAHDFNNMLSVINGHADLMLMQMDPDDGMREDAEAIHQAGVRAADLTRRLLAVSRRQVMELKTLDLNAVAGEMEQMLRRLIRENIEFRLRPAAGLPAVRGDRSQLEQVLMNLVVNARDAMPSGGSLAVGTEAVTVDGASAFLHPGVPPGRYAVLSVADTGVGMTEEVRRRLFEPFFTTKAEGRGTGLGLAVVYGIVRQLGGHVAVVSEPGCGACFRVYLPALTVPAAAAADPVPANSSPAVSRPETVLLVEDDPMVRRTLAGQLRSQGYDVLETDGGPAALDASAAHRGRLDVLLTDIVMPGMSGLELAGILRGRHPGLAVVYMSGHEDAEVARHGALCKDDVLLRKPFTMPDFLAGLSRAGRCVG